MITCTGCHNTLPDWAQKCQFCGADVTKVARPVATPRGPVALKPAAGWVWVVYFIVAAYWLISGLTGIGTTVKDATTPRELLHMTYTPGFGLFQILSIAWSTFTAAVGAGLALRIEAARGVVNFFSFIKIFVGVCGVALAFLGTMLAGPLGLLFVAIFTLDIIIGALTIYTIGETERGAPNF
jgi:hypothetical protein